MSESHEASRRPGPGGLGAALVLAGTVGYLLAADAGHWRGTEIDGIDCNPHEAGDNCAAQVVYGPTYLPRGDFAWLGWSALAALTVGAVLLVVAFVRLGGIRGLRAHLSLERFR